jgi:hypothetical protein
LTFWDLKLGFKRDQFHIFLFFSLKSRKIDARKNSKKLPNNLVNAAMGNPRPLKLFSTALLNLVKYGYYMEKSTKSAVKVWLMQRPRYDVLAKIWLLNRFGLPMAGLMK